MYRGSSCNNSCWVDLLSNFTFFCESEVSCWATTSERQVARIRTLHLKAILKQDMSFFDAQQSASTGQLVASMCADTVLIQEAIGQKVRTNAKRFGVQG